ncbi:MAG: HAMP domain-containing histidine kinase [Gammaproteobacteria bacterium]|nr:HAMP domain-containing histidine kinase [Gammaproteobacteria bacterium]
MKVFDTLYSKLAVTLIALLLIVGIFYALLSQSLLKQSYQSSNQQLNQNLATDLVREMKLIKGERIDQDSMRDAFQVMMLVNPSIEIYFLDVDGRILSFSADKKLIKRHKVDLYPVQQFLQGSSQFPLLGDDPRSLTNQKPFSVASLPDVANPEGYLYVVLQGSQYDQIQTREQFRALETLGLTALAGSLVIGLVIGLLLFYRLTRRIRRLNQSVDRFRGDDLRLADKTVVGDEISQLSHSFDAMAKRIDEQVSQLQVQDNLRREMVANISHDLRTPLAAIHGYIERLKTRFDEMSAEERKEFLDISFRNSARLNHLIEALFELSKLEAREAEPVIESFSISELVQDVIQKFQLEAASRKLSLAYRGEDQLPLVSGDIAMIDRALSNLMDNAISCTDAGGTVEIILQLEEDSIQVRVRDTGKGIDQEHLATLFQRFYQADSRRRNSSRHAGLGLTITHRILELHGQEIGVTSQVGDGTTFLFRLPLAAA